MKNSLIYKIVILILIVQNLGAFPTLAMTESRSTSEFALRTPNSSPADFKSLLEKSMTLSYVDWYLFEAKGRHPDAGKLDDALELSMTQPLVAYEGMNKVVEELRSQLLSQEGRELMVSILIKMSELHVPEKLQQLALQRAQDLVAAHTSLSRIANYKQLLTNNQQIPPTREKIEKQQFDIVLRKLSSLPGLEDSIMLVDGEPLSGFFPRGEHQWALISNVYSPVVFWGGSQEFISQIFRSGSLDPLAEGECQQVQILSNDYQVQTHGKVFSKANCFDLPASRPRARLPMGTHLAELPQVKSEENSTEIWVAAGLVLAAGLIYSLKDKSVSLRIPGLK